MSLLVLNFSSFAQGEKCGTDEVNARALELDPSLQQKAEAYEEFLMEWKESNSNRNERALYTIPVVFHVVYNSTAQNVSDARIFSQLDVLNEDFRRLNSDTNQTRAIFQGVAGDAEVEFCLATVDPQGNPTTGITRTFTNVIEFQGTNDGMKYTNTGGTPAWNTNDYLNIWICNLESGLLGYAYFPNFAPNGADGCVIDYQTVGRQANDKRPGLYP